MSAFEDFQHEEYRHIAEAHFKTSESISSFFRYYLLIMSLPVTIAGSLILLSSRSGAELSKIQLPTYLISVVLVSIGFAGLLIMLYIISLRIDAILYARKVNSIRKYFFDRSNVDPVNAVRLRFLPQTHYHPLYFEPLYFGPVILVFGIINSIYLGFGLSLLLSLEVLPADGSGGLGADVLNLFILIIGLIGSHFGIYYLYTRHSENSYLKTNHIGVDIDGVLNSHREHFCKLANARFGKALQPDQISKYPVQDSPDLGITEEQVKEVFNDPTYWSEMPVLPDAARNIRRLKNSLHLEVHLFTYRPSPDLSHLAHEEAEPINQAWNAEARSIATRYFPAAKFPQKLCLLSPFLGFRRPVEIITLFWLLGNGISHNSLTIESGTENVASPSIRYRNRFRSAAKKKIRYFVEDDWEKALKFAYICDIVFLMDHPYNRQQGATWRMHADPFIHGELPPNVIRVRSWDEIYRWVRQLN